MRGVALRDRQYRWAAKHVPAQVRQAQQTSTRPWSRLRLRRRQSLGNACTFIKEP
jgi:hypothetical protein